MQYNKHILKKGKCKISNFLLNCIWEQNPCYIKFISKQKTSIEQLKIEKCDISNKKLVFLHNIYNMLRKNIYENDQLKIKIMVVTPYSKQRFMYHFLLLFF